MSSSRADPLPIALPIPFPIGHVNAYLLRGEPLTLFDPGPLWPPALEALEAALAGEGLRVEDIELVVLTHQHEDHTGLAATVKGRSGCAVAAHELVAGLLHDEPRARADEHQYATELMRLHGVPADRLGAAATPAPAQQFAASVAVDRPFRDADVVVAGGRELVVHLRPGHSPTDTLFAGGDGVALVGDHLVRAGPVVAIAHRPPAGSPDPRARPRALLDYRRALRATRGDGIRIAHPGHGPAIDEPLAVIASRLGAQERRAAQLVDAIGAGSRTAWEVVCASRGNRPPPAGRHPIPVELLLLSDVLGHLDLLVAGNQAREIDTGDVVRFEAVPQRINAHPSR